MPRFDYQCRKCNHVFEHEHHIGEEPRVKCPVCRGPSKKLISSVGVVFKGNGFYCTDNRKSGGNGSSKKGEKVDIKNEKKEEKETKETTKKSSDEED